MRKGERKKNLTDSECENLVQHLLTKCASSGRIPKGVAASVGMLFDDLPQCPPAQEGQLRTQRIHLDLPERIQAIPQSRRYCFRSIAHALGIPKSTLHSYYKRGVIAKYSSVLKPSISESNKVCRLNWALQNVKDIDGAKFFDPMFDTVHVYGAPGEKIKQRSCKSKGHLLKVMCLSAVARTRWDDNKEEWFDGKIGTWHFTETVPAQRRSSRRDAGTPVMKTVSVTRETYKKMLIEQVIPAIRCKWPSTETKTIKIQQDNARPHAPPVDPDVVAACKDQGWDMEVVFQPPNSPDMNVLDLGFFRAIQTLQAEKHSSCLEDIVTATEAAWADVSSTTLNKNFLTLQRCLQEILESMQMGAICTQIEALKVDIDVDVHADIAAALGLIQLLD
ncbi:hypothetical protein H257_07974 [Aphanomyces astaci]|uniref:Tc1-like transposase DDE domain-containing protein n=1 Tax=Aphanomyces astaci TaxID=112090 RepID=W4GHA3_APHAT|nr:hypothetical protein H257_07974 [Aphanomyces astaci]ETV78434.1 hypothetical protein H257_07974 [Aphanomyces astaci]|eukprot:XP_009832015.1 hypothetical protein H257_07974 [Aphanomyces astaci]